jgi:hypothetical protein
MFCPRLEKISVEMQEAAENAKTIIGSDILSSDQ